MLRVSGMVRTWQVLLVILSISSLSALDFNRPSSAFLQRIHALNTTSTPDDVYPGNRGKSGVYYKVLSETHITTEKSANCICPMGQFWHWRIRQCIPQGPWGYECGFFPKEHWHRVCQDNLKCAELNQESEYFHDGAAPRVANGAQKKTTA